MDRKPIGKKAGFTLVELLVVISIIVVLIGLLLPAVNSAREAGRRVQCANNIAQLGKAMTNYESTYSVFPPTRTWNQIVGDGSGSWSPQARLLPFLEEGAVFKSIDFNQGDDGVNLPDGTPVMTVRIAPFMCPAEPNDTMRMKGAVAASYPLNYAINLGPWFIYDPSTNTGGPGTAFPNSHLTTGAFSDGMSKTLMFSEVKAYQPILSKLGFATLPATPVVPTDVNDRAAMAAAIAAYIATPGSIKVGPALQTNTGHVEWGDGRASHIGFTTTFGPNTFVPYTDSTGAVYDVDFLNVSEGSAATAPTFGALTSRSSHAGLVYTAFMDGSVHAVSNGVDLAIWQALSTRAGGEIVTNFNLTPAAGH